MMRPTFTIAVAFFALGQRQHPKQSPVIRRVNVTMHMARGDGQLKPIHRFRQPMRARFRPSHLPTCLIGPAQMCL